MKRGVHFKLKDSLEIKSFKEEDMNGIIGRMDSLMTYFEKHNKKNLLSFLRTYYIITKAVVDKKINSRKYFDNEKSLEKFDVVFASLYFEALEYFLIFKNRKTPWETYFRYCSKKDGIGFLQMLLGINSHINGDIAVALYKSGYKNHKDFLKINKIIQDSIPEVMKMLAFEHRDLFGFWGVIFKKFFEREFKKIVVRWRNEAWEQYQKMNKKNFNQKKREIHKKTEEIGKELIEIFDDIKNFRNLFKIKKRLENLSINV